MDLLEMDNPIVKKRKFSVENGPNSSSSSFKDRDQHLQNEIEALPSHAKLDRLSSNNLILENKRELEQSPTHMAPSSLPFNREIFMSFVGDTVPLNILEKIQNLCGNDMEKAVNMYFDRSLMKSQAQASKDSILMSLPSQKSKPSKSLLDITQKVIPHQFPPPLTTSSRYIGAFGVNAWATRSRDISLKHGEAVIIERQKMQIPRISSTTAKHVDVIVRFTNSKGEEIGRVPKEVACWVSVLIDQEICHFEGTCIYAPERIRTNDTLLLQLRCSLLRSAFESPSFKLVDDNRTTSMFDEQETTQEKDLRLRQIALVKLFEEIKLFPLKSDETISKETRQSLINTDENAEENRRPKLPEPDGSIPEDVEEGRELDQEQLDALYKKVKSFDFNAPEAEPPSTFTLELRQYQKQALHWMISKERNQKDERKIFSMHPLWEEYAWPHNDIDGNVCNMDKQASQSFYINFYSGELSLHFPAQEQHCLGGILADEMGLGKTIEMMSLIHAHKSDAAIKLQETSPAPSSLNVFPRLKAANSSIEKAPYTTLVVAPMSLLSQWQAEAGKASKEGSLKYMVYYGNEKAAYLPTMCCEASGSRAPSIIITSYGVVLSEFNQLQAKNMDKKSHGGLFSVEFFRVILDEAHHIKNRSSKTARACYELAAKHRWALTGTPIVNRLEDLFSLVRFLRVEPWSNFSFWKTFITLPFESKDSIRALDVVQTVLEPLVLRRTKDMKTPSGEALVPLPPKTINIVDVELSKSEREVYNLIFTRAKRTFAANVEAGTVMKAYTSIFAQILRLRQTCCHPILTRSHVADEEDGKQLSDVSRGLADDMDLENLIQQFTAGSDLTDANAFGIHVLKQIRDEADSECPICSEEPMIEQTVTGCWHSACKKCLLSYIAYQTNKGESPRCFSCREVISLRDIFQVFKDDGDADSSERNPKIRLQRLTVDSAKIVALIKELRAIRIVNPVTKSVVFSQFTSFLSLIESALQRASIPFLRLDGSMAQKARANVLDQFGASSKGVVLLLSLRAGGVGLNLTMANHVFMMDPWWSFAVEAQAIDRVHRMGQMSDVRVSRFIVKESVEERMLKVQERKKFM